MFIDIVALLWMYTVQCSDCIQNHERESEREREGGRVYKGQYTETQRDLSTRPTSNRNWLQLNAY